MPTETPPSPLFFIRHLLTQLREAGSEFSASYYRGACMGAISVAELLGVISLDQGNRLNDLASNCSQHRRRELVRNQPPYSKESSRS